MLIDFLTSQAISPRLKDQKVNREVLYILLMT